MRGTFEDHGSFQGSFKLCTVGDTHLDSEYLDILKGETFYWHLRVGLQSSSFVEDESLDSVEVCLVRRVLICSPLGPPFILIDLCRVSTRFNRSEQAGCRQKLQGEILSDLHVSGEMSPLPELLGLPRQNWLFSLGNLKYFVSLIQLLSYSEWDGELLEGRTQILFAKLGSAQFCFSLQPFSNWQILV